MAAVTVAYSYTRFSSAAQADGDSVRRQTALRQEWLKRHPDVKLNTSLTFIDSGVSGFEGKHRSDRRNALAQFLELVEGGRVPKGSWLIVESVDRLSREDPSEAIPFVLSLIKSGIRIVTLSPSEIVYEQGMDQGRMIVLLLETFRGHGESARKKELCGEAWREKKRLARVEKKPLGKQHPGWIDLVDGKYVLKPDAAASVREIFKLAIAGRGTMEITRDLNNRGIPGIGKRGVWVRSYVQKILMDRTTLGEYQPTFGRHRKELDGEVIEGYYPPVVTPAQYAAARTARQGRFNTRRERRPPRISHPFQWLLTDALDTCGMYTLTLKGRRYIVSAKGFDDPKGGTHRRPFPLDIFQTALLQEMKELKASDLFGDPSGTKIAELEALLSGVERKLAIAVQRFEADPENATWAGKVDEYDRSKRKLARELAEAHTEAETPLPAAWAEAVALMASKDPERLRAALRRVVEDIRVLIVKRSQTRLCAVQVFFASGASRLYVIRWTRSIRLPHCKRDEVWGTISGIVPEKITHSADIKAIQTGIRKVRAKLAKTAKATPAASAEPSGLDLRRPDDVKIVEGILQRCDLPSAK